MKMKPSVPGLRVMSFSVFALISIACSGGSSEIAGEGEIARVAISPSSDTVFPAERTAFSAQAFDDNGDLVRNVSFDWSISDTLIASVDAFGDSAIVIGQERGSAEIIAEGSGISEQASISVVFPEFRANEPSGLTGVADQSWEGLTDALGRQWSTTDWSGDVRLVSDLSAAPMSPPVGLEQFYPEGLGDGEQAGLAWTSVRDVSPSEIYMATTFRSSSDWVRCPNGHKLIIFQFADASGTATSQVRVGWNGSNDTENHTGKEIHLAIGNGFDAEEPFSGSTKPLNNNEVVIGDEADVEVGNWAQVEVHIQMGQPGRIQLWVNGVLVSDHEITWDDQDSHIIEFQHAGTYGGGCTTAPLDHSQSLFYGHTYLSAP